MLLSWPFVLMALLIAGISAEFSRPDSQTYQVEREEKK